MNYTVEPWLPFSQWRFRRPITIPDANGPHERSTKWKD